MERATITIITSKERRGEHAISGSNEARITQSYKFQKTKLISSSVTFSLHWRCAEGQLAPKL
jgi:hypothetical protein